MSFSRITARVMPDGTVAMVSPFHVSMEGMEKVILCRDGEDHDVAVKYLFLCARRKNNLVVDYVVMSNHAHAVVLAEREETARQFANEYKRCYAQYFRWKYKSPRILRHTSVAVLYLDSDGYLRNALAYIPRNVLDIVPKIEQYRWTGYRAMFRPKDRTAGIRPVCRLSRREKESILHTHDDLKDVPWFLDKDNGLEPGTCCETEYLEGAFRNDPGFYLRMLGTVNRAEMDIKLIEDPRHWKTDQEIWTVARQMSQKWFCQEIQNLTMDQKARIIPYIYHTQKTHVAQLARCFHLERTVVARLLGLTPPNGTGR